MIDPSKVFSQWWFFKKMIIMVNAETESEENDDADDMLKIYLRDF